MLLPMELDNAMSPSPILATITLVSKSGTDVPAAKRVNPMITEGMPIVWPMISAQSTVYIVNLETKVDRQFNQILNHLPTMK